MMTYQETVVRRDQHQIHVQDHPGAGPPIILMHGFPDNLHLYDRLVPYLSSPPRRVVLFDFLGWGSSDKPSGYPYTTANQVGDLDAVITQLGLEQILLVAHDASGPPAIDWALAQPERVAGLVLLKLRNANAPAAGGDLALRHARNQKHREACVPDVRQLGLPSNVSVAGREVLPRRGRPA
jgi:pimeloyl-ACP methyl ester carboxylesterase